jgi:hypothetical protein
MAPFLSNIFGLMGTPWEPYEGMYMVPRDYTSWERPPSIPFSFLINLPVRAPVAGQDLDDPNLVWKEIILLSRDLIATLDLEPYHQIENTNVPREDLESLLREMALFDALFTLRQWPPSDTPVILRELFGDTREEWMKTRLGWNVADAVEVYTAVNRSQPGDPIQISHTKLLRGSPAIVAEVTAFDLHSTRRMEVLSSKMRSHSPSELGFILYFFSVEAMLDLAAGLLASQVQALRHDLLRTLGKIEFKDGTILEWRNRRFVRLTVTLLSHGSLQNSDLFWTLFNPLLNSELAYSEGHPQGSKIDSLNRVLSKMRGEIALIQNTGLHISIVKSECASLSVGQLAAFLKGVRDLNHFLNRIQSGLSYRSFDPVFEFVQRQRSGQID